MTVNEGVLYNRIKGALYGVAIGDALGAPREFLSADEAMKQFGRARGLVGGGVMNCTAGHGTDDTQMTLDEAYSILENSKNPVPVAGDRFIEWMIHDGEGIGIMTSHVLSEGLTVRTRQGSPLTYDQWMKLSRRYATSTQRAGGNGALMRSVYPGLYYSSRNEASNKAIQLGRITHWDINSDYAVMVYTQFIHDCTSRYELPEKDQMQEDLITAKVKTTRNEVASYMSLMAEPTGWVVDSMKNVLDAFQKNTTFESTLMDAVERGGDADTIGAITGGIAGAWYGFDKIPDRWISQLDKMIAENLDELAEEAFKNRYGEPKRNRYRISFVDGYTNIFSTREIVSKTRDEAVASLFRERGENFEHRITSICENGKLIEEY